MEETTWLFLASAFGLAAYAAFAVAFAKAMMLRNPGSTWLAKHLESAGLSAENRARWRLVWRLVAVPLMICAMAAVVAALSVGTTRSREVEDIYAVSVALVAAVRILAYLWPDPAGLLAEMAMTALLAVFLFNFGDLDVSQWKDDLIEAGTENSYSYVIGLFIMEWVLAWFWRRPQESETDDVLKPNRETARS